MEKVYQYGNSWSVNDLTDLYSFKCVNILTNEETKAILSWKKGIDCSELGISEEGRIYSVELNGEEILFVGEYKDGRFSLRAHDGFHIERILRDTNIAFVGENALEEN